LFSIQLPSPAMVAARNERRPMSVQESGRPSTKQGANIMTFQPGQSGNPASRAAGSRNRKTLALEAAFFARAEAFVAEVLRRAMAGEPAAMRLCMERVLPVGRGRGASRGRDCGAANGGAALVNINENTAAARDGDAAGRRRIGAKPPE
jgi:Family of unknown function (DUF5681)